MSAAFVLVCFLVVNKNTCQTKKNVFYLNSKALRSQENQILEFCVFKFHDIIK